MLKPLVRTELSMTIIGTKNLYNKYKSQSQKLQNTFKPKISLKVEEISRINKKKQELLKKSLFITMF